MSRKKLCPVHHSFIVMSGSSNQAARGSLSTETNNNKAVTTAGVTTTTQYLIEDDVNPTGYAQVPDELSGTTVARTYTYGLQRISQNQYISNAWLLSYYQYDGGGSVRQLTNSVGQVTDSCEYDAFGNKINSTGTTPNNYLYRGEQYDPDLGLYYLRARYYNPVTGRFLSRDPLDGNAPDPKSLHKYLYADGDPVNAMDPTGQAPAQEEEEEDSVIETIIENIGKKPLTGSCIINYVLIRTFYELSGGKGFPWWPAAACSLASAAGL
jgi:RHS repeat-associated protein